MNDVLLFTPMAQVVGGLLLLLFGRRLFWLFVAVVGFFIGAQFGALVFPDLADWALLLVALGAGVIGAVMAIVLQRLAVAIAGGIAGGMLAVRIAPLVGLHTEAGAQAAFVAGVLLAAVLLAVLFDPVLIVISALLGAVMITEAFPIDSSFYPAALIVLTLLGVYLQVRSARRRVV